MTQKSLVFGRSPCGKLCVNFHSFVVKVTSCTIRFLAKFEFPARPFNKSHILFPFRQFSLCVRRNKTQSYLPLYGKALGYGLCYDLPPPTHKKIFLNNSCKNKRRFQNVIFIISCIDIFGQKDRLASIFNLVSSVWEGGELGPNHITLGVCLTLFGPGFFTVYSSRVS